MLRIYNFFVNLQNFTEIKSFWKQFVVILSIYKASWGHVRSHTNFGPDRFGSFDVYWIQTNTQTHSLTAKYIHLISVFTASKSLTTFQLDIKQTFCCRYLYLYLYLYLLLNWLETTNTKKRTKLIRFSIRSRLLDP